jgi:RimJ/RimL family protein N-acetyltransferase
MRITRVSKDEVRIGRSALTRLAEFQTGRGLMTAAVKALIDEGFQESELNRIQARSPLVTPYYR